ncbi:MAG TPA: hypothetical protein VMH24_05960, partial [Candidatus Sulfotelmatobacter sp.]|nr:hypothetical protein [Candidatus Sulfotelmatobacter sp.]
MFATLVGPYPAADLRAVLLDQLEAGLELLTDGELGAADPVVATLAVLDGVTADGPAPSLGTAWAGSRPMVRTLPAWRRPALVDRWRAADAMARALATERNDGVRPVRAGLLGPYTLGRLADRGRLGRRRVTLAFAEALGVELAGLDAAGAPLVQVDEPALVTLQPGERTERALAAEAWRRLAAASPDLHLSLGVMHGAAEGA